MLGRMATSSDGTMMNCSGFAGSRAVPVWGLELHRQLVGAETTIFVCPGNPAWKKEGTVPYTQGTCGTPSARARCLQKEKARTMTGFGDRDKRTA